MLRNAFSVVNKSNTSRNFILAFAYIRPFSSGGLAKTDEQVKSELEDAYKRQRKTEWKRRQRVRLEAIAVFHELTRTSKGQSFLDNLVVTIRGGLPQ